MEFYGKLVLIMSNMNILLFLNRILIGRWLETKISKEAGCSVGRKITLLDRLNFTWVVDRDELKMAKYLELLEYVKENQNVRVPVDDPDLGGWVTIQRRNESTGSMNQLKKKLLDDINFIWDVKEDLWDSKYQELCEFFEDKKHTNVSKSDSLALAAWATRQKVLYSKNELSKDRIVLEKIIFAGTSKIIISLKSIMSLLV